MLILAKLISKVLKTLNSEVSPNQIAAGFAFGALVGLIPVQGLLPWVLLVLSFVLNINLVMVGLATAIFKAISYALDPVANHLGYWLLTQIPSLKSFWTFLYNMPIVPFTRFNNTIVIGSVVIGGILFVPLFLAARFGVSKYRATIRERIMKAKLVQMFQATSFYRYYQAFQGIRGE